jgi:hypothetical protein
MENPIYYLLLLALIGLLFIILGIPLKQGAVRPNLWYGFRTRKTLSDETIWYDINRVLGIDMIRCGMVITASSLVVVALRNSITPEISVAILVAVTLIMVVWMAFHGFYILRRM